MDIDFRLWMLQPHVVVIPSPSELSEDICVMIEAAGLYYRYRSFGADYTSQDIVAKDLGLVLLMEYMEPSRSRGLRQVSGSLNSCGVKTLVDELTFSLQYGYNTSTNYTRFALRVPLTSQHFDRHLMNGIESSNIEAQPFSVPPPLVCKPFQTPLRGSTHDETSIYLSHAHMKLALDILTAFVGPSQQQDSVNKETASVDSSPEESIFSMTAHVERVKCQVCDPVMGMHRPLLSICFPSLLLTASQLQETQDGQKTKFDKLTGRHSFENAEDMQASIEVCYCLLHFCLNIVLYVLHSFSFCIVSHLISSRLSQATLFIDYFNLGLTRTWEPFVEPFKCLIMYEKSASRGKGITFNADCPLHANITGSLIGEYQIWSCILNGV
jgi:hypothetical protein